MTNKGINPLYVSALDVLIGTLGVFIVLNFLHSRLLNAQQSAPQAPVAAVVVKPEIKEPVAKPAPRSNNGSWWQRTFGQSQPPTPPNEPSTDPRPQTTTTPPPPVEQQPNQAPAPPQDPVAVDLMKQTQGAVVILLQQSDRAKNSVEMMLRQGSRTWKPSRASKYQDQTFAYQKGLNYFYQKDIEPGTYDVMVRIRRGSKAATQQPFALFGKIVPAGRRTQTYAFGRYAINGSQDDWVSAGQLVITGSGLTFRSHLSPAPELAPNDPGSPPEADPTTNPVPVTTPPPATPKKRGGGKWG